MDEFSELKGFTVSDYLLFIINVCREIQQSEFYSRRKVAMLLFKVEETTTQSQFLAHYSFTPIGKTPEGTAFHIKGGKVKLRKNSTLAFSSEEEKEDDIYSEGNLFYLS